MTSTPGRGIDLERWPHLAEPRPGARADVLARSLRHSVRDLDLRLDFPDDTAAGDFDARRRLVLVDPRATWGRIAASGVAGLADAFVAGEWTSPDLVATLTTLAPWIAGHPELARTRGGGDGERRRVLRGRRREDGREESVVPGELVSLYADETMSTTPAVFVSGARSRERSADGVERIGVQRPTSPPFRTDLATAQRRTAEMLLDLTALAPGAVVGVQPVGWGELPLRAAERGLRVRTRTSSPQVLAAVGARIRAAGMADEIALSLGDPAERTAALGGLVVTGIAASEVQPLGVLAREAVAAGGSVVLRADRRGTGPGAAAEAALGAWIDDLVPGAGRDSHDPRVIAEHFGRGAGWQLVGEVDLTEHAAETARLWRENFTVHGRDAAAWGFDPVFRRMWALHLAALESAYRSGWRRSVVGVYSRL